MSTAPRDGTYIEMVGFGGAGPPSYSLRRWSRDFTVRYKSGEMYFYALDQPTWLMPVWDMGFALPSTRYASSAPTGLLMKPEDEMCARWRPYNGKIDSYRASWSDSTGIRHYNFGDPGFKAMMCESLRRSDDPSNAALHKLMCEGKK